VLLLSLKPEPSLSWKFAIKAHRTRVDRLVVRHVPAHAAVNLTCRGKGCPFAAAPNISGNKCHGTPCRGQPPSREGARAAVDLAALFTRVKIAAGAKLTVSVTAKNTVGREWVFTVRAHNTPTARAACLRPGLSVPTTSCSTS
jgi:hypothetical protein